MTEDRSILLVEDDFEIGRIMGDHLRKEGYQVTWATTGQEGWEEFKLGQFSLVIVDLMLPEIDGFELCKRIRLESELPMLIVSAKHEDESKIRGLDLGADDYLTKPFSLQELSARISSHLRRYQRYMNKEANAHLTKYVGGLKVDFKKEAVHLNEDPLSLTAKEHALLFLLVRNPFQTFSKSELYTHIWQELELPGSSQTVTVHIKGLRAKLCDDTRSSLYIQTIWGVGYRFIGEQIE